MKTIRLFVGICVVLLLSLSVHAGGVLCSELMGGDYIETINQEMAIKYPKLSYVIQDPDIFMSEMRMRFEEKKKALIDPYTFDYSEIGLPAVQYASDSLKLKKTELDIKLSVLKQVLNETSAINIFKKKLLNTKIKETETMLRYLLDLSQEANNILKSGQISYIKTVTYMYYLSRAIGHFDQTQLSFREKLMLKLDRRYQGYKQLTAKEEYAMYKADQFSLFQLESKSSGFSISQPVFKKAFTNSHQLETIIVPSAVEIDRDLLMRLMSKNINIIGLTDNPYRADGFARPSGDFWMHDLRHETAKLYELENYKAQFDVTEEQYRQINRLQDYWFYDLQRQMALIPDENLRAAVSLVSFNFHHDRGFPLIPSVWRTRPSDKIVYALLTVLTVSGQGVGYKNVFSNTKRSMEWLTDFWKKHESEENAVLQKK